MEMTVKEYLYQVWDQKAELDSKLCEIESAKATEARVSGAYNAMPGTPQPGRSEVEGDVTRLEELREDLEQAVSQYADKYAEISAVIDAVKNSKYRALLRYRYLSCLQWDEVADKMHYCYVHIVHNLHPQALDAVKELIDFNIANPV